MEENTKRPSHISYKEYQKKVTKNPNDGIVIFVSAFFILLLLFLGIAKQLSPEIDVSIGDEKNLVEEDLNKSSVDERLKLLKEEDDTESPAEKIFAEELDEKVVLPENKSQDNKLEQTSVLQKTEEQVQSKPEVNKQTQEVPQQIQQPNQQQVQQAPKPVPQQPMKVVVGYYATKEQAEVAKGIILEAGLNIAPFVRNIGGAYTIQVGSFASREKAQNLVNDLLRNNYPARIISE